MNNHTESPAKTQATCPNCQCKFCIHRHGGIYGLHPSGFDDVFFVVLCGGCNWVASLPPNDPARIALRDRVTELFQAPSNHIEQGFAVTTLKILELHGGDLRQALAIGWPFPMAMHHYDVCSLPGGIVLVSAKDGE